MNNGHILFHDRHFIFSNLSYGQFLVVLVGRFSTDVTFVIRQF